ncbi:MAG TPA: ABC transporter permease, partial [Bacteroidota bacterium]
MFANYVKIALRNILRHKWYSAVNILGLALGISCSLMIAVLITFELGFDMHHPKGERLYRIVTDELRANGRLTQSGGSPGAIAEALLKDVSDVEQATLVFVDGGGLLSVKQDDQEKKFELKSGVVRATTEFFVMFDIQFLYGSAEALKEPGTVVLAQSVAERFFGSGSAVGKTLRLNNSS